MKKAVTLLSELTGLYPRKTRQELLRQVELQCDLSPLECEFLDRHFKENQNRDNS